MISCETFEDRYTAWKNGSLSRSEAETMEKHSGECSHCADFNGEIADLRAMLSDLPAYEPAPDFQFKLRQRIREATDATGTKRRASLVPRWAAWGAGLATGLAIGVAVLLPTQSLNNSDSQYAMEVNHDRMQAVNGVPVAALEDSISDTFHTQDTYFDLDRHSQTVSGGGN